jgi:hypothetical protein
MKGERTIPQGWMSDRKVVKKPIGQETHKTVQAPSLGFLKERI